MSPLDSEIPYGAISGLAPVVVGAESGLGPRAAAHGVHDDPSGIDVEMVGPIATSRFDLTNPALGFTVVRVARRLVAERLPVELRAQCRPDQILRMIVHCPVVYFAAKR